MVSCTQVLLVTEEGLHAKLPWPVLKKAGAPSPTFEIIRERLFKGEAITVSIPTEMVRDGVLKHVPLGLQVCWQL